MTTAKASSSQTQENKCLYILKGKGKWGLKDILKPFNAIYNGTGWFIEDKHREEVAQICERADLTYFDWPLKAGETFKDLKRQHNLAFFHEKAIKTRLRVDSLKATLGFPEISIDDLSKPDRQAGFEQFSEGRELLEALSELDRWQGQIKRAEEDEKIANITVKPTFKIPPYNLKNLQEDLQKTKEGLKTGYKELDTMVRIPSGAITLVAGRPSHGKTTFMLNLFLNLIKQYPEQHFYFFSYEETLQQIAIKIINILSEFPLDSRQNLIQLEGYLKSGSNLHKEIEDGKALYQELVDSGRLRIVGESYQVRQLASIIRWLKSEGPVGAVFIDYIQKIKNEQRFGTRQLELADTSHTILEVAKECSIPIVLGAQLGRDSNNKDKVKLENLREAGDLEQDANLVLGLFNPTMEKAQNDQTPVETSMVDVKVTPLKNRNGSVNIPITLKFDRPILTIKDS